MKVKKVEQFLDVCPACAEEGNSEGQPLDAFYTWPKPGYKKPVRSYLCRRHTNEVNAARDRRKLDPKSPDYDKAYHDKVKQWKRDYAAKKLDPKSPDYDPEFHERQKTSARESQRRRRKAAREAPSE